MNLFQNIKYIVAFATAIFLFQGNLFSQINNPFEIKSRIDSVRQVMLKNNRDTLPTSGVSRLFSEDPLLKENKGDKNETLNPFDVSHTPLSKTVGKAKVKPEAQSEIPVDNNSFLFWILIFSLALFAIVINIKTTLVKSVFRSAYNLNLLKLFQREEKGFLSIFFLLLYLIFAIELSSWIFIISSKQLNLNQNINLWLILLVFIIGVYSIRHFFLFLLGLIYGIEKTTSLYSLQIGLFNIIIGILLIPFNFLISFGPELMQDAFVLVSVILAGLIYLSRIFLTFFTGAVYLSDRIFQFIVYLCLFEIAPMWILIQELKTLTI